VIISFVIPCYCSGHTLNKVVREIKDSMEVMSQYTYEIILVDDGSPDGTFDRIRELAVQYSYIKGINLARNFGQHAALMAGFRHISGDVVVCLDDDGQTPADEVGKLISKIEEGFDVVYARYENKKHSLFRNIGSKMNEIMTCYMLEKPKDLYISSYFAAKRFIIDDVIRYENSYPYVMGLVIRTTGRIANVTVNHRNRETGRSGYTLKKLWNLWFNGFTSFSVKPLHIATTIGGICALGGFVYGLYTILKKFIVPDVPIGYSAMMSALVFFCGMIMLMLGLIGEYIGRIYISINNAPQYVVREFLNIEKNKIENNNE